MIIKIEPNHLATKRTKERIKQHGPFFNVEKHKHGVWSEWLLREANPPKGKEAWIGWIERREFTAINGLRSGFQLEVPHELIYYS